MAQFDEDVTDVHNRIAALANRLLNAFSAEQKNTKDALALANAEHDEITAANASIAQLNATIADLKAQLASGQAADDTQVKGLQTEIADLEAQVEALLNPPAVTPPAPPATPQP